MLIKNCTVTINRTAFAENTESNSLNTLYSNIDGNYYQGKTSFINQIVQDRVKKAGNLIISNLYNLVQVKDEVEIIKGGVNIGKFIISSIDPYIQFDTLKLTLDYGEI